jgi:dTDP-4-amino-4,6-dideoxygalactose transaminase
MKIPFNKPFLSGKEIDYIKDALDRGKISGNGHYTQLCHEYFRKKYGFSKCLLTTSCTDALEMAAILCNIKPGDEVIVPSYTFVSTANAFILRGAKIVFADSRKDHPGIDEDRIEELITSRTKVIVPVHYAGFACNMKVIMEIARRYNLIVVEDAAQAIDSYFDNESLGGIGNLGCFSFHETKNIQCGEGGMLAINDESLFRRSEIIWEKGTNRAEFFRGEVNKYGWIDIGSSFLPSEINAAFLFAQFENIQTIQTRRLELWNSYYEKLLPLHNQKKIRLPYIPVYSTNNAHIFYIIVETERTRNELLSYLNDNGVFAIFHYLPLHKSPYFASKYQGKELNESDYYGSHLIRLPLYYELTLEEVSKVADLITEFFTDSLS